jgi:hypothetical protein
MRRVIALACCAWLAGCVLPRPHHRKALVVDALVVGAGAAFLVADAWDCRDAGPDGCHPHNDGHSANNITGSILVIGGFSLALLTAIVVAAQGPAPAATSPPVP